MSMLLPMIGSTELVPGSITVVGDKGRIAKINESLARAAKYTEVTEANLAEVVQKAKELKSLEAQIEADKKAAKRQFLDINTALEDLAKQLRGPVLAQYDRLTKLLAAWKEQQDKLKAEAERLRRIKEQAEREARERAEAQREAERQALIAKQQASATQAELDDATVERDLFETGYQAPPPPEPVDDLDYSPSSAPIPGAITTTRYKFTLEDPLAAYKFSKQIVKWDIQHLACMDVVRSLQERNQPILIPGVRIETYTDVSTRGSAPVTLR